MPVKSNSLPKPTKQFCENVSFENQVEAWLLHDGWEVFKPNIDHGSKTDVLISDGNLYYRIQVKSLDTNEETVRVKPAWKEEDNIDFIIYFSKKAPWGYIAPKFNSIRKLKNHEHFRFHQERTNFLRAFNKA